MAEDSLIRHNNLKRMWDAHHWTPTLLSQRCGGVISYWSDLYHGRKSFGEKVARKIEVGMGLARNSMDNADGARFEPFSKELRTQLATLEQVHVARLENAMRSVLGMELLAGTSGGGAGNLATASKTALPLVEDVLPAVNLSPLAIQVAAAFDQINDETLKTRAIAPLLRMLEPDGSGLRKLLKTLRSTAAPSRARRK